MHKLGLMDYVPNAHTDFTMLMAIANQSVTSAILGILILELALAAMEVILFQEMPVF